MRVLAAADKFKGTATAAQVCAAIGHACWDLGIDCVEMPMADGGEGTLDVLGGPNRTTTVTGPLGAAVEAQWRLHRGVAVIEMARASGLTLAGGATANDPIAATTAGTGELINIALNEGAKKFGRSRTAWIALDNTMWPSMLHGLIDMHHWHNNPHR